MEGSLWNDGLLRKEMILIKKSLFLLAGSFCLFVCLISCDIGFLPGEGEPVVLSTDSVKEEEGTEIVTEEENKTDKEIIEEVQVEDRLWSILIYMSADNNLEGSALEDFTEMELSEMNTEKISVFILLDRSSLYDTSNGNWTGTKLFRLKTGRTGSSRNLISEEIDCKDLSLTAGENTELDMSSEYVLSDSLSFIRNQYPAEKYGLVIWGHGTGWRSGEIETEVNELVPDGVFKGVAFDDDSKTYMTLKQLGRAISTSMNDDKLDFLGFDTCFGAELEVMYELKNYVNFAVGCEGLLMSSGWDYTSIFNSIQNANDFSSQNICEIIARDFSEKYKNTSGASISVVNMKEVAACFNAFDEYMGTVADMITTRDIRDDVMGILYSNKNCGTKRFTYGAANSDVYLDIKSCVMELQTYFDSSLLDLKAADFTGKFNKCISYNWNWDDFEGGLGVYFQTLSSGSLLSISHPSAYIQGKTIEQIDFVADSQGYVPGEKNDKSLLEKLFYTSF